MRFNFIKKALIFTMIVTYTNISSASNSSIYLYPNVLLQSITSDDSSYRGISPKLALGYGAVLGQSFFLAGEVSATIGTAILSNNTGSTNTSLRVNRSYDFSILPGMLFSEHTMGFLRFGVVSSNFSQSEETATGGEIGVGLQFAVANCWYIRGEYIYTTYSATENVGAAVSDTFALGAVYTFY
jgi:opacity protein-like surface antigen